MVNFFRLYKNSGYIESLVDDKVLYDIWCCYNEVISGIMLHPEMSTLQDETY